MNCQNDLLKLINVSKSYVSETENVTPLKEINMSVCEGQFIAVVGRSGSGKTTLLNVMAGLDKPTSGEVLLHGADIALMDENSLTEIRRTKIGFIFQQFHLLPHLTALENIQLPLDLKKDISKLEFYDCKNFLEMAEIIKSSKIFIGNLSFGYTLAEGLKVPRLLESNPEFPLVYPNGRKGYDFYFQNHLFV